MSGKPKLTYFNGRGLMESVRWLLAAAGVEFEEVFLETREQYLKLVKDGYLLFDQVPLVEMDGLKLVQTKAILNYIAGKYNLLGKDLKERAQIDMYVEGTMDLMGLVLYYPFSSPDQKEKSYWLMDDDNPLWMLPPLTMEKQLAAFIEKAETRYLPVYEKALKHHNQEFLVGNHLSWADIQLLEAILMLEERKADILAPFPQLQAFKARTSSFPTIKKFLEPGSQRKPIADDAYVAVVLKVLQLKFS